MLPRGRRRARPGRGAGQAPSGRRIGRERSTPAVRLMASASRPGVGGSGGDVSSQSGDRCRGLLVVAAGWSDPGRECPPGRSAPWLRPGARGRRPEQSRVDRGIDHEPGRQRVDDGLAEPVATSTPAARPECGKHASGSPGAAPDPVPLLPLQLTDDHPHRRAQALRPEQDHGRRRRGPTGPATYAVRPSRSQACSSQAMLRAPSGARRSGQWPDRERDRMVPRHQLAAAARRDGRAGDQQKESDEGQQQQALLVERRRCPRRGGRRGARLRQASSAGSPSRARLQTPARPATHTAGTPRGAEIGQVAAQVSRGACDRHAPRLPAISAVISATRSYRHAG